jgi:CheY-like chemotaxis protein
MTLLAYKSLVPQRNERNEMRKILAVDDDNDILDVIRIILEDEGYEVATLTNGRNIIDSITNIRPDLILLDVMLSGMDGREICRTIKANLTLNPIPIIMISASHNLQNYNNLPGPPNGFIPKPFDIDKFVHVVNGHFTA